jgi:hypothetical protein
MICLLGVVGLGLWIVSISALHVGMLATSQ